MKLLTIWQHKLNLSLIHGYLTAGVNLSPSTSSTPFGGGNLCPWSGSCAPRCLDKSGRNNMPTHVIARARKSVIWLRHRGAFKLILIPELEAFMRKAEKMGLIPYIRPNLLSDLFKLWLMIHELQPELKGYDYTKRPKPWERVSDMYHLTFSLDTHNVMEAIDAMLHGINVAVPFDPTKPMPTTFPLGGVTYPVINGDEHDLRFLDAPGHIVSLKGKYIEGGIQDALDSGFYRDPLIDPIDLLTIPTTQQPITPLAMEACIA